MILDHEANIAHIYRYTDTDLRLRMKHLLNNKDIKIWKWNECRASWQHHSGATNIFFYAMAWSKYSMTVLPSLALILIYWRVRVADVPIWEQAIFIASIALFVIVLSSLTFVGLHYHHMGNFGDSSGKC